MVSLFILNVFVNSWLAFGTVLVLIEGFIFLFRIPQGRMASFLRMIPLIKLPLDLFLYNFSRWTYTHGINPLDCAEGSRMMSAIVGWNWISAIEFTTPGNYTFTLADMIGLSLNSKFLQIFTSLFLAFTAFYFIRRIIHHVQSFATIRSFNSTVSKRKIKKCGVKVLLTSLHGSPFVIGSTIYIPKKLSERLSKKEYEAVLTHELEHIRYKDNGVRLLLDLIAHLFWWVPTKGLQNRIEEGQEVGCDLKCNRRALASALCKSAQSSLHPFAHLKKHPILKRLKILAQPKPTHPLPASLAIGLILLLVPFGRFWIF